MIKPKQILADFMNLPNKPIAPRLGEILLNLRYKQDQCLNYMTTNN